MSDHPTKIFVVAHNGGYEGHALPSLAFWNKGDALGWCAGQTDCYSVAEVPIHPAIQPLPWFRIDPMTVDA